MNDTINQDYRQAKTTLTKAQEKALKTILKKEGEIKIIQQEIGNILAQNDLGALDVDKFKREKNIKTFLDTDFS